MNFRTLAAIVAITALSACATTTPDGDGGARMIPASQTNTIRAQHVDTLNAFRAVNGMGPVRLSASLTAAAATHARDMSIQRRAWHFGSDGSSPPERAARAGFTGKVTGENISESFDDPTSVFQSWVDTPETRSVMLDPTTDTVGFAWYQEPNGKLWWVQVLGAAGAAPVLSALRPGS